MGNKALKVCLIKHATYPDNVRTRKEAQALIKAGHHVDVICLSDEKDSPRRKTIAGVNVYRIPVQHQRRGIIRYLYEYLAALVWFTLMVGVLQRQRNYDIVQIANMPDFHIFAALIPKLGGAKVVINLHECMPEIYMVKYGLPARHPIIKLLEWVEQRSIAFADHAITCNEEMSRIFAGRGAPADKFTAVLNTPEQDRFIDGVRDGEQASNGAFHLITHGSIEERYGIETAVRAMALLRRKIPGAQLEVFGKGTALEQLKALAEELELNSSVRFRGFAPHEELAAALQTADVGLVTLLQDHATRWVHTNKMFEYISIGKPAIISRSRSLEDYFDDESIAFFDNNDPQELARIALELYRNPDRRATLAHNAAQIYDQLKWSVQSAEYCRLLEGLANHEA